MIKENFIKYAIKILEYIKNPTKIMTWLLIISIICLFLPIKCLQALYIEGIITNNKTLFGIIFLITITYLIIEICIFIYKIFKNKQKEKKEIQKIKDALKTIDFKELSVLREFFVQISSVIRLPILESPVISLVEKKILTQVGTIGEDTILGPVYSYALSPIIEKIITPEFVNYPKLKTIRPKFMQAMRERQMLKYL